MDEPCTGGAAGDSSIRMIGARGRGRAGIQQPAFCRVLVRVSRLWGRPGRSQAMFPGRNVPLSFAMLRRTAQGRRIAWLCAEA